MNVVKLFRRSQTLNSHGKFPCLRRALSASINNTNNDAGTPRDPAPLFFSPPVQNLLHELTGVDMEKVFEPKKLQKKLRTPEYKFMTTEDLEMALEEASKNADKQLQMPPILLPRTEINKILSNDPALKGWDKDGSAFIFTDITFGKKDSERLIVKRDADGVLSHANWAERDTANQAFNPFPGRKWKMPRMFEPEHFNELLKSEKYIFILDRACIQFEPNNPKYIEITQKTYEHVSNMNAFEKLRSTRHFGPMAFHLAWNMQIDYLVMECLQRDCVEDAVKSIMLLHSIHPEAKSAKLKFNGDNHLEFIKKYASEDSSKRGPLELIVQSFVEHQQSKNSVQEDIKKAHRS